MNVIFFYKSLSLKTTTDPNHNKAMEPERQGLEMLGPASRQTLYACTLYGGSPVEIISQQTPLFRSV
jgi:hypothetical protein